MALIKIVLDNGNQFEVEMPAEKADNLVAAYAQAIGQGKVLEHRVVIDSSQSIYVDFKKVAVILREF